MKLETTFLVSGITITKSTENNTKIICDKVKLTNKRKLTAQKTASNQIEVNNKMCEHFMRVAQIERKKDKKANFFNKHKNNL